MDLVAPEELGHLSPEEIPLQFGIKAAGLLTIPTPWRPAFRLISAALYRSWLANDGSFPADALQGLKTNLDAAAAVLGADCILRSSATDETIRERGTYLSAELSLQAGPNAFVREARAIFEDYRSKASGGEMCLILQARVRSARQGYLSNELRMVDKPYRWAVETEISTAQGVAPQTTTLSAKQASDYDIDNPLICISDSERSARLKSVARHFWKESKGRLLLEWCWDGARLWIVQRDQCAEATGGINPLRLVDSAAAAPAQDEGVYFKRYQVGASSPWGKLKKVSNFSTGNTPPPHRLFYATAATLRSIIGEADGPGRLAAEIDALTSGRAVLRTDAVGGGYNLNRTNTVSGAQAVDWVTTELAGVTDDTQVVFILHAFIHAGAAAWSYYKRGDTHVRVDGLWGLADAMQYYPVDTFLYFPRAGKEVSTTRFKSHVLVEKTDGEWQVADVDQRYARRRSLTKAQVKDIAGRTLEISDRTQSDVQIMWFVGVPSRFSLGENLPWFMATAEQNIVEQRSHLLRSVTIRNAGDLERLTEYPPASAKVILEPSARDIRSETFIERVAEACTRLNLPVEIRGSILSHAFHQLTKAGVQVFSAEPGKTTLETRQRKSFHKIVRDNIPEYIEEKGEIVSSAQLESGELVRALIGKLVEEMSELLTADTDAGKVEELADVLEVVRGLASALAVSMKDVEAKANKKRERRGGFDRGIVLQSTSLEPEQRPDGVLFDELRNEQQSRVRLRDLAEKSRRPEKAAIAAEELLSGIVVRRNIVLGQQSVTIRVEMDAANVSITLERVVDLADTDQIDLLK